MAFLRLTSNIEVGMLSNDNQYKGHFHLTEHRYKGGPLTLTTNVMDYSELETAMD